MARAIRMLEGKDPQGYFWQLALSDQGIWFARDHHEGEENFTPWAAADELAVSRRGPRFWWKEHTFNGNGPRLPSAIFAHA